MNEIKTIVLRRIFQTVIFLLSLSIALVQEPLSFSYTHYTTATGLLSNQINTVVQDEQGYIWVGTTDGLQRFDGYRYKTFRHNPKAPGSLPSNPVLQLMMDKKNNLWVLLADGRAGIFNTKNFTFREADVIPDNEKSKQTSRKKLIRDDFGNVYYLLQAHEILTFKEKENSFTTKNNFFRLPDEWGITDFIQEPGTKKFWLSIQAGPVAVYNAGTGQLSYFGHNVDNEPIIDSLKESDAHPFTLMFDQKGRLWFQTWEHGYPNIYCFNMKTRKWEFEKIEFHTRLNSYYELHTILQQRDGSIWVSGMKVFAKYNERTRTFDFLQNGSSSYRNIDYRFIRQIYEDREHNIWAAAQNNGLYRFNPEQEYFINITHNSKRNGMRGDGSPLSYFEMKDTTMLVGIWDDGLYRYDKNWNSVHLNIDGIAMNNNISVWSMAIAPDSNILWMGAQPGIWEYDLRSKKAVHHNPPILQNRTIRQVATDRKGNLWIGMQSLGLFKWTISKDKAHASDFIQKIRKIPQGNINKILADKQEMLWIATASAGLYIIDPETERIIMHFSNSSKDAFQLPEAGASCLLEYNDSIMVIATSRYILLYDRKRNTLKQLGSPENISGFIASVEKDKEGFLWISTTNGLYRVHIETQVFTRFDRDDGIDNEYFSLGSSHVMKDGRMIFGSESQFILFNPSRIRLNHGKLTVAVTDFKVMDRQYQVDSLLALDKITLRHDQKSLSIDFSCLSYNSSNTVKFKLEGLDKEWQTATGSNNATYSYLQPGNYTFLAYAISEEGKAGTDILKLKIIVTAPFYRTWWFYSLLTLMAFAAIYWADQERMKRKEELYMTRTGIADNLHKEINTALNNINILSDMARLKATKDPQKSIEFIEQINARSKKMIIAMDDMLWSLNPENDSMSKTLDRMQEYIDAWNNRNGLHIEMHADQKVKSTALNMKFRSEVFLLFKECLLAIVNASADHCLIHVTLEKNELVFTIDVRNDFTDKEKFSTLFKHQDIKTRMEEMEADIHVNLHKSSSVFVIHLPVK